MQKNSGSEMSAPKHTGDFISEFRNYHDCFSVIGGTPTVLYFEERLGKSARTTKDLDIVILDIAPENRWKEFLEAFRAYIKKNEYDCKSLRSGKAQSYRFENPKQSLAPKIIEVSSRRIESLSPTQPTQRLEEFEMSAIVCEPYFVDLLKIHKVLIPMGAGPELPSTKITILILMKAFAALNLDKSKDKNDRSKRDKHLNDIARLTRGLTSDDTLSVPKEAFDHLDSFLKRKTEFYDITRLHGCGWKAANSLDKIEEQLRATIKLA